MSETADVAHGNVGEATRRETESCFRLIYRSRSLLANASGSAEQALAEILHTARTNNSKKHITGALVLYEYRNRFAQVLEGLESDVMALYETIRQDSRHDNVETIEAEPGKARLFRRWAMALVLEHRESDVPLMATSGGISEAAPWRVSADQEEVLSRLRDLTRGFGRGY